MQSKTEKTLISIDEMAIFCRRKGFVYPSSEIYGSLSGFFDYGPLGVELKNNIKREWWKTNVQQREDMAGIDGSIISHQKIWEASGHLSGFSDIILECKKCKEKVRGDVFIEDRLKISTEGLKVKDITQIIKKNKLKCLKCGGEFKEASDFNLMFPVNIGANKDKSSIAYLRGETAQLIFANFKKVAENSRLKLPFGIAQIGKAFRNEIAPRNFLFRCREFEQMEIEYFVKPVDNKCPYIKEVLNHKIKILSTEMQEKDEEEKEMTIKQVLQKKIIKKEWHAYWLAQSNRWFISLGANPDNFRIRQHKRKELAHYSSDCWDLEYKFPFGFKELEGIADRSDYDLQQHIKHSGQDLSLFDEETKQKIIPHVVAEPSLGVDRAFLVFMFDAYEYDKKRENIVLKLHPKLSPIKVAVFPLLKNKKTLVKKAKEVYDILKKEFVCAYDTNGSIGRRYARQDEAGTFLGVTIDFDSLKKNDVTIRSRDTTRQVRVKIKNLKEVIKELIEGEKLSKFGKYIY
ncbi:glycine--tRNA ligase [Candidatus Woesearchaeota archaeon]|nr:glycine--tRNA ligase [Candidatus Woesearchaeota archaeon]